MSADLIDEILDLRRVPRRLRDSARLRLEEQSASDLDLKAQRLRAQRATVENWSKTYINQNRLSEKQDKESFWARLARDEVREEIASESNPDDLVAKALRLEKLVGTLGPQVVGLDRDGSDFFPRALRWIVDEAFHTQQANFSPAHPVVSEISVGGFINAIGRLKNEIEWLRPDAFVTINRGGMCVANLVIDHMNLSAPVYGVTGAADTQIEWLRAADEMPQAVVCVVGHVAHTGDTMNAVIESAKTMFKTGKVYGALIAASDRALNGVLRNEKLIFHQKMTEDALTIREGIQEPWLSPSENIIRAILDGQSLAIDEDTVQEVRRYMADRYPVVEIGNWQRDPQAASAV